MPQKVQLPKQALLMREVAAACPTQMVVQVWLLRRQQLVFNGEKRAAASGHRFVVVVAIDG